MRRLALAVVISITLSILAVHSGSAEPLYVRLGLLPLFQSSQTLAPIEYVEIVESPDGYSAHIVAGLPNSCHEQGGYTVSRNADSVRIEVYNTVRTGPCSILHYRLYELDITLGADFVVGQTYTVEVNDRTTSFEAR